MITIPPPTIMFVTQLMMYLCKARIHENYGKEWMFYRWHGSVLCVVIQKCCMLEHAKMS